jgi:hypothetical protein
MSNKRCDLCGAPADWDGQTVYGSWAYMCDDCRSKEGTMIRGMDTLLKCVGCPDRQQCNPKNRAVYKECPTR